MRARTAAPGRPTSEPRRRPSRRRSRRDAARPRRREATASRPARHDAQAGGAAMSPELGPVRMRSRRRTADEREPEKAGAWELWKALPRVQPYLRALPARPLIVADRADRARRAARPGRAVAAGGDPQPGPARQQPDRDRRVPLRRRTRHLGRPRLDGRCSLPDHRPRQRLHACSTTTSARRPSRTWCSTCAATSSPTPSGSRSPSTISARPAR